MEYDLLSLFCGAGGLDHGFHRAGFRTVVALDNCPDAVETYNKNNPGRAAQQADLSRLNPEAFLDLVPKASHPIGLIGGPPCQGFSRGNVCADPRDPRNRLPYRYADLVAAANKKYGLHFFVFENVIGLTKPKHAKRLARILARLERAGFNVAHGELNASDFGVPQRRRRLFIVGLNKHFYPAVEFQFPFSAGKPQTVSDAIRGLPVPSFFKRSLKPAEIHHHPNHWTMVPKSRKFTSSATFTGRSFKRLEWNAVSPTVAYGHREIHIHPEGRRRLSVYEAMLLQGFPRNYELTGSLSAQVTQISNAVPPPVACALAVHLRDLISKVASNRLGRSLPPTYTEFA